MNRLILLRNQLEDTLQAVQARPDHLILWRLGLRPMSDGVDLLGSDARLMPIGSKDSATDRYGPPRPATGQLRLALSDQPEALVEEWTAQSVRCWRAFLAVGVGPAQGRLATALLSPEGQHQSLHALLVVGPGMHQFPLVPPADKQGHIGSCLEHPFPGHLHPAARWSRTRGAGGVEAWRRLTGLRYGVVGCGRSGSLLAQALAASGVHQLILVDPDRLKHHNLGEMVLVNETDLSRPKAEALAYRLSTTYPWLDAQAIAASVTTQQALEGLARCDVLCCCVDRDSARLATGILAALYLKPLLDIGTAVLHSDSGEGPVMGADVRLILPGEGCLLCQGGVAQIREAQHSLESAWAEAAARMQGNWRRERAGSLLSLNQVAVGLGLRLWENLVAERQRGSTWLRLEFDREGQLAFRVLHPRQERNLHAPHVCLLCPHTGAGDAGLQLALATLSAEVK